MPCSKRWIRSGGSAFGLTVTASGNPTVITVGRRTLDRSTKKKTSKSYSRAEAEDGIEWQLVANRIYDVAIVVEPPTEKIQVRITIGGVEAFAGTCSGGSWPVAADFRVTTRKA